MSYKKVRISRTAMSTQERRWRSQLAQSVAQPGVVRGTLQERYRVCGRPNCRCTRGYKHRRLYLVMSRKGRLHQVYIPRSSEATVRQWVDNYQNVRDLLEKISDLYLDQVEHRQA